MVTPYHKKYIYCITDKTHFKYTFKTVADFFFLDFFFKVKNAGRDCLCIQVIMEEHITLSMLLFRF